MAIQVVRFQSFQKNTLQGFLSLRMSNIGLEIRDLALHEKDGKRWVQMPAKPYERDGKVSWSSVLDFFDKARAAQFQRAVLAALDEFQREGGGSDGF